MSVKKLTPIKKAYNELSKLDHLDSTLIVFFQALQMEEREMITEAYKSGAWDNKDLRFDHDNPYKYYEDTFENYPEEDEEEEEDLFIEVEFTLVNGTVKKMSMEEVDINDWEEIKKGTKALLTLVNGQTEFVIIDSADYDGISFRVENNEQLYNYEENVIYNVLIEVEKP